MTKYGIKTSKILDDAYIDNSFLNLYLEDNSKLKFKVNPTFLKQLEERSKLKISPTVLKQLEERSKLKVNPTVLKQLEERSKLKVNPTVLKQLEERSKLKVNPTFSKQLITNSKLKLNLAFLRENGETNNLNETKVLVKTFENLTSDHQKIDSEIYENIDLNKIDDDDKNNLEKIMDEISYLREESEDINNKVTNIQSSIEIQSDDQFYYFLLSLLAVYILEIIKMQS